MIGYTFGDFNLQDPAAGLWVTDTNVLDAPPRALQADELAGADGALIVKRQYKSKQFYVKGYLRTDSRAETETLRDAFMTAITRKSQAFDVDYGGGVRRYLADYLNVTLADRGLSSIGYTIEFLCPDGMGWSLENSLMIADTTFTTSARSISVNLEGSYEVKPIIQIDIDAVTGGADKTVTVQNGDSLRGVVITRTWTAGDVINIDALNGTLYVNNQEVDYLGELPKWESGEGTFNYLDDFTTRTVTAYVYYTPRWL